MDFFDEEPFDSIFKEFFNTNIPQQKRKDLFAEGEEEDRFIDFIALPKEIFLIVELPGYKEEDIGVSFENRKIVIKAQKINTEKVQSYLTTKLASGVEIRRSLPPFIKDKKLNHTFKNGILEIRFNKVKND
jgi:HSP20 family molecular chaperone IbpA